jgi:hypothetical protein
MKTIKSLKDITTLEVGDKVVFGDLEYTVCHMDGYFLRCSSSYDNDKIFTNLNISKRNFVKNLGINTLPLDWDFPEVSSLEALTAIVSALLKEYEKQNELPKTWEEFCKRNPVTPDEYWIETIESRYCNNTFEREKDIDMDKNVCVSLQEAQAFTALMQLRQLRKAYVKDWEPDWENDYKYKYGVNFSGNKLMILEWCETSCTLSFPTEELAKQFLNNFKDLLEIAKPLL